MGVFSVPLYTWKQPLILCSWNIANLIIFYDVSDSYVMYLVIEKPHQTLYVKIPFTPFISHCQGIEHHLSIFVCEIFEYHILEVYNTIQMLLFVRWSPT